MIDVFTKAIYLSLPLVIAGSLHMVVVRKNMFRALAHPISNGWFGQNKTWRGIIVMVLASIFGVWITQITTKFWSPGLILDISHTSTVGLGIALGLAYTLSELPNSFVKRRVGIKPGQQATRHKWAFTLVDQADSAIGCAIIYAFCVPLTLSLAVFMVALATVLHLLVNVGLYSLGLRREPF